MSAVFASDADEQRFHCRSRWDLHLHREVPDEATLQGLITKLKTIGADGLEAFLIDCREGQQRDEDIRALLDAQAQSGH